MALWSLHWNSPVAQPKNISEHLDRRDVTRCMTKLTRTSVCDVESNALDDDKIGREAWVIQEEEPCARGDVTSVVGGDRERVGQCCAISGGTAGEKIHWEVHTMFAWQR